MGASLQLFFSELGHRYINAREQKSIDLENKLMCIKFVAHNLMNLQ